MLAVHTDQDKHIAYVYDDDEESLTYLTHYFSAGLENDELCVWVTELPEPMAMSALKSHGLANVDDHVIAQNLRIFNTLATYLQTGTFIADYMLKNVEDFLADAKKLGYNGLRTAGEMNWLAEHPEKSGEAMHYERAVNGVHGMLPFTGLCLYASDQLSKQIMTEVNETHPFVAQHHVTRWNPAYVA